jgi:hypothetical protein
LINLMKLAVAMGALLIAASAFAREHPEPRLLTKISPLPMALDPDFQFRKTKLYFMGERAQKGKSRGTKAAGPNQTGAPATKSKSGSAVQDASINFERQYRLFGAVTKLDQRERFGNYLDFFWRARRPADVTVRLEYQQEKLHAHVQAQEISYHNVRGTLHSEFKVIGDDYFDNGRIIAWRCVLVVDGRVVAEGRSFLWRG